MTTEANLGELSSVMSAHGRAYLRARDHFLALHPELVQEVAVSGLRLHGGRLPQNMTEQELRTRTIQVLQHLLDALRLHGTDLPVGWAVRDPDDMGTLTSTAPAGATFRDKACGRPRDVTQFLARWAAPAVRCSLEGSDNAPASSPIMGDDADRGDHEILGTGHSPLASVEAGALREEFLARVIAAPAPGQDAGSMLRLAERWPTAGRSGSSAEVEVNPDVAYDMGFDGVSELADAVETVKQAAVSTVRAFTRLVA